MGDGGACAGPPARGDPREQRLGCEHWEPRLPGLSGVLQPLPQEWEVAH